MGAGFLPRTDLFAGQLETLPNGAIKTDEYMRVPRRLHDEACADVLAAGDSCTVLYNPTGTYDYIPLATNAVRQALLVGCQHKGARPRSTWARRQPAPCSSTTCPSPPAA